MSSSVRSMVWVQIVSAPGMMRSKLDFGVPGELGFLKGYGRWLPHAERRHVSTMSARVGPVKRDRCLELLPEVAERHTLPVCQLPGIPAVDGLEVECLLASHAR